MMLPQLQLPWAKTSELSANSRLHWRKRHRLVQSQKINATALAREKGLHLARIPEGAAIHVTLTFCPPSRVSSFDDDNAVTAQKGALDAIAAVLRVDDSRFRLQAPQRGEKCRDGGVIVNIEVME
ncbi:hypothetical protein [Paracoccus sulfuroxidans]|uniref:Uncharacterized protein n=1 Tax=Paracoccus sulfuroxidans TaxID=384678 RepID=A0A562NKM6_9RHOB|nr:hypothetical protein [Paracoccus sulfuroxidans]TWI32762.1 hypothetical protein IQ24_02637 [Paracoccus sulfuroxidans]